jgi:hypothetical protein
MSLFIEVPAPTRENEWLCICVLRVSNIPILFWKWFDSVVFLVCHFTIHNNYTDSQKTLNSQRTQGQLWRKSRSLYNLNMYKCRWNINSWLFLLFSQYAAICLFQSLDTLFQSLNSRSGTQSPQNLHAYKLVYTVCIPLVFLNFIAEWCRPFCFIMSVPITL